MSMIDGRQLSDRVSAQLTLAKQWLRNCSFTHDSCQVKTTHRLPSRLLAVNSIPMKLVLTANMQFRPAYATLSHCWGKLEFLKLTSNSLNTFQVELPAEVMTKKFLDAIFITKKLGLEYLWIDSLCIMQDSSQDWHIESALMSSVYGGAVINIAVTGASDGWDGCFCKRTIMLEKSI